MYINSIIIIISRIPQIGVQSFIKNITNDNNTNFYLLVSR